MGPPRTPPLIIPILLRVKKNEWRSRLLVSSKDKLPNFACYKENDLQGSVAVPWGPQNRSFKDRNRA